MRRGRDDDTSELIARRISEQSRLLAIEDRDGWLWREAGIHAAVNTSRKIPQMVLEGFVAYISGEKDDAF